MKTHVFAILDRSGSMAGLDSDTIGGYNKFIDDLKKEKGACNVTLTIFDTEFDQPYSDTPVKQVPKLDGKTYWARGGTALIDAFCRAVKEGKSKVGPKDKAIVLVITDGMENSSRENTTADMKALVEELDAKKNWTFSYLGANQDSWGVAQAYGFKQGNVANFNATHHGMGATFQAMSASVGATMRGASLSTDQLFSDEQKAKLEAEK